MTPEAKMFLNKGLHWMAARPQSPPDKARPTQKAYTVEELRTKAREFNDARITQFINTLI